MTKKNQFTVLIIALAMLLTIPAGNVFANDYSIYGNEIIALIEGEPTPFTSVTVSQVDNLNIYGAGFDTIFFETNRLVSSQTFANVSNMSIYGDTVDTYLRVPVFTAAFDFNFLDRLVFNK